MLTVNAPVIASHTAPALEVRQARQESSPDIAALAALAMEAPVLTIQAILRAGAADETLRRMAHVAPGAVEALWRSDDAPRSFRQDAEEALEEAGWVIQH